MKLLNQWIIDTELGIHILSNTILNTSVIYGNVSPTSDIGKQRLTKWAVDNSVYIASHILSKVDAVHLAMQSGREYLLMKSSS